MPTASLRALLAASLDYAGLFPPASLPLTAALHNYAAYLKSNEAWLLARFVCPTAQLSEAAPHLPLFSDAQPLAVSALGRKSNSTDEFIAHLRLSLNEIAQFCAAHGARVSVEQLEAPLPPSLDEAATHALLTRAADTLERVGAPGLRPFFEVTLANDWQRTLHTTIAALAAHNAQIHQPLALKLRTGGIIASAFPTTEQITATLLAARDHGLALKFTAGLHHPLRRYDDSVQTRMHGFINVFAASVLAQRHALDSAAVQMILDDEDASRFHLTETGLGWGAWWATPADLAIARRTFISFGSCSFDEPRADLRAIGWL